MTSNEKQRITLEYYCNDCKQVVQRISLKYRKCPTCNNLLLNFRGMCWSIAEEYVDDILKKARSQGDRTNHNRLAILLRQVANVVNKYMEVIT